MPLVLATFRGNKESYLDWKVPRFHTLLYQMITHGEQVRGIGTSLSTATNWAGNLLIGSTYLSLMAKITPAGAFGFYAGLCLVGWIFVLACFPETAGLSLEEVKMVFKNGFGIRESQRLINAKKEIQKRDSDERARTIGEKNTEKNVEKS
jgi:SP family myo-inositol transporter-like MFS transporter 13